MPTANFFANQCLFETSPKHKAWRSSKSGSYYIYCLCEAIVQHNGSEDLANILLEVNARTKREKAKQKPAKGESEEIVKEHAAFVSMMRDLGQSVRAVAARSLP